MDPQTPGAQAVHHQRGCAQTPITGGEAAGAVVDWKHVSLDGPQVLYPRPYARDGYEACNERWLWMKRPEYGKRDMQPNRVGHPPYEGVLPRPEVA